MKIIATMSHPLFSVILFIFRSLVLNVLKLYGNPNVERTHTMNPFRHLFLTDRKSWSLLPLIVRFIYIVEIFLSIILKRQSLFPKWDIHCSSDLPLFHSRRDEARPTILALRLARGSLTEDREPNSLQSCPRSCGRGC